MANSQVAVQAFKLNTGDSIPALGLGTWQAEPGRVRHAVKCALMLGYRHIDAAFCYGNEDEVGLGLNDAFESGKVRREDVFVTTKLWCTYHTRVEENLALSLQRLNLEYIDLWLLHWPIAMNPEGSHPLFPKLPDGSRDLVRDRSHVDTYRDMEKMLLTKRVKAIGVANYSRKYLEQLLAEVSIVPAVNQIENHPLLPQQEIVDYCKEQGVHVTAYSPLGSTGSPLLSLPVIQIIAAQKSVSAATVLLSWHVSCGRSVLAKSINPSRIEENFGLVRLGKAEVAAIQESITERGDGSFVRYVYPEFGVNFGFPDKS